MNMKKKATIYDLSRMCKPRSVCEGCPLEEMRGENDLNCFSLIIGYPDKVSDIVLKWCDEHQVKTYKQDFLEKFPNAPKFESGTLRACRRKIYGITRTCGMTSCEDCWNEEMPNA